MALPIRYNIRNLGQRWKVTLLAIFGIALVVAAVVVIASMSAGFSAALRSTGSDTNAIVTQRGSLSELTSWINIGNAQTIMTDPRIARDSSGTPLASCEIVVIASKPKKTDNQATNITLRGVTPEAFKVRTGINLVEGRMFSPGVFEVIAGKKISDRVKGLDIGDTVRVQRKEFKVVGLFTADGSSFESEMWGDYNALGPAVGRNGGCESLTVRLTNPAVLSSFDKDLRANPQMQVQADSERTYYENQAGGVAMALKILAGVRGPGDGHRRGVWRDEYDVRHRVAANARDRHAASAGIFTFQHFAVVRDGVGAAGLCWRSAGMLDRHSDERLHRGHGTNAELQRVGVRVQDHAGDRHRGTELCSADGVRRRIAAGAASVKDADYDGATRSVSQWQ